MKKINKIFKAIKKIRLSTLIILIALLSFNSYAWFIFATKVSTGMSAHVASWNVLFSADQQVVTTQVVFNINTLYPGMPTQTKTLTAYNNGEVLAVLSYKVNSIRIMNATYTPTQLVNQAQLLQQISNDWPFQITFTVDNSTFNQTNGSGNFTISFAWPYESGNDAKDTLVGTQAYNFQQANPTTPTVHIEVEVQAIQDNSGNSNNTNTTN